MVTKVSYSQYSTWASCPQKWKFKYIDKLDVVSDSIHTLFGTAMHTVVQWWLKNCLYGDKSLTYCKTIDLSGMLKEELVKECTPCLKQVDDEGVEWFLFTREEIEEFYQQGIEMLYYIQQNALKLFPTENTQLFAIEYLVEAEIREGIEFIGYIDVVTWNPIYNEYTLYDLKSTTKGWNKWKKKDAIKRNQLLLYKKFFSEEENVPIENVLVEFVIMKRTIWEDSPYPIPRVSKFEPPNAKQSVDKAWKHFLEFIDNCHDGEGNRTSKDIVATPAEFDCTYCDFNKICEFRYDPEKDKSKKPTPDLVSLTPPTKK